MPAVAGGSSGFFYFDQRSRTWERSQKGMIGPICGIRKISEQAVPDDGGAGIPAVSGEGTPPAGRQQSPEIAAGPFIFNNDENQDTVSPKRTIRPING